MKDFLWSIFGNSDDPMPPDSHWPGWPKWVRVLTWYLRNPAHDLFFYRWGIKGITLHRIGDYPNDVFNPSPGWNRVKIICRDGKTRYFRSYWGPGFVKKFYIGYREKGNWGFKFIPRWSALFFWIKP